MARHNAACRLDQRGTNAEPTTEREHEDGLQHASGVTPSLSGSTSRWDTLPRLGAVERPRPTLPDAFNQAGAEPRLPTTDGRDRGPRARRCARASGVPLPRVPVAASAGIGAVPLARGATRGLCDAARHTGTVGEMMGGRLKI